MNDELFVKINDYDHLLGEDGFGFLVKFKDDEYAINCDVFEVVGIPQPSDGTVMVNEYLGCSIKWDGCSHFWFGEKGKSENLPRDSYLHLCGEESFKKHCAIILELFRICKEKLGDRFLKS